MLVSQDTLDAIKSMYSSVAIGRQEGIQEMRRNIVSILEQNLSCQKKIELLQKLVNNV